MVAEYIGFDQPHDDNVVPGGRRPMADTTIHLAVNRTYRGKVAVGSPDWGAFTTSFRNETLTVAQVAGLI